MGVNWGSFKTDVWHNMRLEEHGHRAQGRGAKPARSRVRVICTCDFEGPWRKFFKAAVEDRLRHQAANGDAGGDPR